MNLPIYDMFTSNKKILKSDIFIFQMSVHMFKYKYYQNKMLNHINKFFLSLFRLGNTSPILAVSKMIYRIIKLFILYYFNFIYIVYVNLVFNSFFWFLVFKIVYVFYVKLLNILF